MRNYIGLGLLFMLLTVVQQTPQKKHESNQENENRNLKQEEQKPTVNPLIGKSSEQASTQKAGEGKQQPRDWLNFAYLLSGPLVAIVAGATLWLVIKQVRALKRIERGWLVIPEIDAMPGGMSQAKRGWITQGFGFIWAVKNCGRTPVLVTRIGARFHRCKIEELPKNPDIEKRGIFEPTVRFSDGLSIGPNETISRFTLLEGGALSTEEYGGIQEGRITFLAYGVVEYRTVFDKWRTRKTHFCYVWNPGTQESFLRSPVPRNYTKAT